MKIIFKWSLFVILCMALLPGMASEPLKGDYIGGVSGQGRSPLLRKSFTYNKKVGKSLLRVNSLGYHEAYVNGEKVGDAVLTPAVSQLSKRSLTVTYDISSMLKKGKNELVLWTGSGWYKALTFGATHDGPLVKAEVDVVKGRDTTAVVWTDATWTATWSGYSDDSSWRPHQFGGETIDARVVPSSLDSKALDALQWQPVEVVTISGIATSPQQCELCRVQETIRPVNIRQLSDGKWLIDFGKIVNAMLDISLPKLPAGHVTTAAYSDILKKDGGLEPTGTDTYISSGMADGDRFVNRFNHHVFRYVVLDNLPVAPQKGKIAALRMRTDYRKTASFRCSDEDLNRIHDMVAWTLENLAFNGYMTDCANIERLGYGGDGNASTPTLQTLFDVSRLYDNWLQAWLDVMQADGGLPHTAPSPYPAGGGPYWCSFIVQAPWRTYMSYGNIDVLWKYYPAMKSWLKYVDANTKEGLLKRWPDTDYRNWYLGDWAAPEGVDVTDSESVDLVNNCVMCQVYLQLEMAAMALGEDKDATEFRHRYDALKKRINEEFYHADSGIYGSGSQIDLAYPLLTRIVPDKLKQSVRNKLIERTEELYGGHLATGLVGVPIITEWATLNGEADWIYGMLKKHGYPGYLYMLDNGATGTWEHWNGARSRLHNCYNGIGTWFYQALGGIIADEPGYRHVRIEPQVPEGLEWVHVTQDTPYGTIVVDRKGSKLHVELPEGVTATIKNKEYSGGSHDFSMSKADKVVAALHDPTSQYVVVVSHRGDWRNYPENSLPAIESVIKMDVDVMELDLKKTKDGVLVLCHDGTINRTTTGSGKVSDYTYEELMAFDLKRGHGIAIPGMKMPTLRQALELCKDRIVVNVDQGYEYYDEVLAITEELGMTDQVLIKSSNPVSKVDEKLASHPNNMMYMPVINVSSKANMEVFNGYINAKKPPIAFELCFGKLDQSVIDASEKVLAAGSKVWVNTIWGSLCGEHDDDRAFDSENPDEIYGPILNLGTSIIQTDRPEFIINYLKKKGRRP